jgi:hypothetical protein
VESAAADGNLRKKSVAFGTIFLMQISHKLLAKRLLAFRTL